MLQITDSLSSMVRIQKARTTLLLDHPFFGTLLFRLGAQARSSIATMATDGVSLYFNPQFVETLSAAEIAGTLAHEVMHPALQHHTPPRRPQSTALEHGLRLRNQPDAARCRAHVTQRCVARQPLSRDERGTHLQPARRRGTESKFVERCRFGE